MFTQQTYIQRRDRLTRQVGSGLILLPGNDESPMNYAANTYPFRQDSTFLYVIGLDAPGLAAVLDVDHGSACVFGDDPTVEQCVWTGPRPTLADQAAQVGIQETAPMAQLGPAVDRARAQGRRVHILPPYRGEHVLWVQRLLGLGPEAVHALVSEPLARAVVAQRSIKSDEEVAQIEQALDLSYDMHTLAMRVARPGRYEREVVGQVEAIPISHGSLSAFPTILSIRGEILHNHFHENLLKAGDLVVHDSGAESPLHYASDITRTIPVSGRFSDRQREVYQIVLCAQEQAIAAMGPGVEFRSVHRSASRALASGLKDLGLIRGDVDQAVEAGAHTLFFQCGLGHMLGLDVHDMEGLGEDYVGYTDTIRRNPAFGWRSLRMAKALEPGHVMTVEPGIYFIDALIDQWKAQNRLADFIDYGRVEHYRGFGGIRVEDNVLVTPASYRILGRPIPKTIEDVEAACASGAS